MTLHRERRRRLAVGLGAGLIAGAILLGWPLAGRRVRAVVRGEATIEGAPVYAPEHPMSDYARQAIDFDRVHRELIPAWTLGIQHTARSSSRYWRNVSDERFEALAAELEPDPNLTDLMTQTHTSLREDPIDRLHRLDYWLWAYNRYLDDSGVPWRLEASLFLRDGRRPALSTRSYEILADARNPTGQRVRLLRRADRLGSVEGWLGRTGQHGDDAMVLMRRVLHFTVRHVWPALHPALDGRRPAAERSWAPWVRQEVSAALDPETFRLLSETAEDQQALIEVTHEIEARAACGSRFRIYQLPYNGLSRASLHALEAAVYRSRSDTECPEVTLEEAAQLVGASERLASTDGIEEAIERLTMVVARSVAAHEIRHAADGDDPDEIPCPGCPEGLDGLARAEVSAYLAAMSTEGLGYLALFQACATPSGNGVQGAARDAVVEALLPFGCEGPTLWGLYAIAGEIESDLFGERPRAEVPDLPDRVALLGRPQRADARRWTRPLASGWGMQVTRP
ncbi:MAG: hypothetical protein H6719_26140 [Sandaracinaceae bacterium]|nr:hypothetical protein [Sandaracinaceae bacterium]